MTPEQWQRLDVLFHAAVERPHQVCGDDSELGAEATRLLQAHDQATGFARDLHQALQRDGRKES